MLANCSHPSHFAEVLPTKDSRRSPAELDEAKSLDPADPEELGSLHRDISAHLPRLAVQQGHGGTDQRHVAAMARATRRGEPALGQPAR